MTVQTSPHPATPPQKLNGGHQETQINIYWPQLNITKYNATNDNKQGHNNNNNNNNINIHNKICSFMSLSLTSFNHN